MRRTCLPAPAHAKGSANNPGKGKNCSHSPQTCLSLASLQEAGGIETVLPCWHYWHPPASTSNSSSRLLSPPHLLPSPLAKRISQWLVHSWRKSPLSAKGSCPSWCRQRHGLEGWGHSQGVQDEQGQRALSKHSHGRTGGRLMLLTGTGARQVPPHPSEPEWGTSTLPIPWPGQEGSSSP